MGPFENALERLSIVLPPAPKPVAAYVPFTISHSGMIFVSGQLPFKEGKLASTGAVPTAVSIEQATEAARLCCLNALAVLKDACGGDLDKVVRNFQDDTVLVMGAGAQWREPKIVDISAENAP